MQDKHVIYIDESGFGLDMHPEYSYARRGCRPYRVGQSKSKRLNLIMGITKENVFAYQIRKGAHNEHSFISFLLDVTRKAYELGLTMSPTLSSFWIMQDSIEVLW